MRIWEARFHEPCEMTRVAGFFVGTPHLVEAREKEIVNQ